jgi:hypothetical protein
MRFLCLLIGIVSSSFDRNYLGDVCWQIYSGVRFSTKDIVSFPPELRADILAATKAVASSTFTTRGERVTALSRCSSWPEFFDWTLPFQLGFSPSSAPVRRAFLEQEIPFIAFKWSKYANSILAGDLRHPNAREKEVFYALEEIL